MFEACFKTALENCLAPLPFVSSNPLPPKGRTMDRFSFPFLEVRSQISKLSGTLVHLFGVILWKYLTKLKY